MAQIPTLQSQVRLEAAPNVQQRPLENTAAQSIGAGLTNVGTVAAQIQHEERLKADRAAFMDADRETDTIANDIVSRAQTLQGKDAIGSAPKFLEEFDQAATQTAARLKGSRARLAYQEAVNSRRASLQRALDGHEGQQREAYYAKAREDYKDQAHINAVSQYQDPKAIEGEVEKIRSAIDQTPGMDDAQRATELGVRRSGVYTGVVQRYLANDNIAGAEKFYQSVKDRVNGDKAAYIENAITDAKRAAEARARVLVDRRDALAERAVAKMQQQIMAGVPATPAAWVELRNTVAGTSSAGEFENLVNGEREVQTTLRMPIGEQVRLVQEKEAALATNGGTLADAANVARLKNAVTQNVKLLQTDPLVFAEKRAETPPATPIDLTTVTDSASQPAIANELQSRLVNLRAISKRYGTTVPMKPLLPQEAAQLSAMLGAASPAQATQLMSSLRDASGDMDVFKGVMQQIAPDNPVLAAAGLLAAQRAELVTGHNWFSPDPTVTSKDVAATIIKGQSLLAPSKGDKATDGKPQTKNIYLPEGATLQAEFQNMVGDAFAGRPAAADLALQAVRAYYAGRAAEKGRIAADSKDIDGDIVSEAVRNVVGNVTDYNDNGKVVLPWGMTEDDFNDRAEAAVHSELKRRGLEGVIDPDMASFGLTNTNRDGVFAITIGRNLKLDAQGQPITIDIRPPDARDQRGFIVRGGQ